jgi:hypothetical protein
MRKTIGLVCAAALLLPVGVITASPAAAAAGTVCSKAAGTGVFTPAIPKGAGAKKASKLSANGTVSGCSGSVKSGKTKFVQTSKPVPGNCQTLLTVDSTDKPTVGTLTITWNTGKTSTAKGFKIKQTAATEATTTGKITSGLFVGKVIKGTVSFKPKQGDCVTTDLKSVSYTNKSGTKFVVR